MEEELIDLLAAHLKIDKAEVKTIAETDIKELEKKVKERSTAIRNDGIGKGKSDAQKVINSYAATKNVELSDEDKEDISKALDRVVESQKSAPAELTEEAVKKSKVFTDAEEAHRTREAALKTELEGKVTALKKQQQMEKVSAVAMEGLNLADVIIPEGTAKDNLVKAYLAEWEGVEPEYDKDGKIVAFFKDGNRLEDDHKHPLGPNELSKKFATNWFIAKEENKNSPDDDSGKRKPTSTTTFKDDKELNAYLVNPNVSDDDKYKAMEEHNERMKTIGKK